MREAFVCSSVRMFCCALDCHVLRYTSAGSNMTQIQAIYKGSDVGILREMLGSCLEGISSGRG